MLLNFEHIVLKHIRLVVFPRDVIAQLLLFGRQTRYCVYPYNFLSQLIGSPLVFPLLEHDPLEVVVDQRGQFLLELFLLGCTVFLGSVEQQMNTVVDH